MIRDVVCNPIGRVRRSWCVFTSAGDANNILTWFPRDKRRKWDLIVAFYGESERAYEELARKCEVIIRIKGAKFQNLKKLYAAQPGLFKSYSHVWVADDDLSFKTGDLHKLFELAGKFGFLVCQPAFSAEGRVSHPITGWAGGRSLARIVNFVENTCPVFRTDCLIHFLEIFDGSLVGWGIDYWFCQYLGSHESYRFAIIDEIVVLNPLDHQRKIPGREITKLLSDEARMLQWHETRDRFRLQEFPHQVIAQISRPGDGG